MRELRNRINETYKQVCREGVFDAATCAIMHAERTRDIALAEIAHCEKELVTMEVMLEFSKDMSYELVNELLDHRATLQQIIKDAEADIAACKETVRNKGEGYL